MIDLTRYAKPNKTIREHTDDLLYNLEKLRELRYIHNRLYQLMKIACEHHDYGKINDEFQKRVKSPFKLIFDNEKEVAHNVLSLCFLEKNHFEEETDYYKVAYAILNHHHNTNNYDEIKNKKELIEDFTKQYGGIKLKGRVIQKIADMNNNLEAILLKGFLHKCDYAASGNYQIEYGNDFLIDSLNNNLLKELKKSNMNAKWNEMQEYCYNHTTENIVVIANTGMGKTEAGLLWIGDNKGFFILPLKTAINAIYNRVRNKILMQESIEERLALLHSDTTSYYLKESVVEEDKIVEYTNKGKNLSLPLTISTLDQIFDFVYRYNGYELKLATLSYSKIVIDEVQAYSPDLLAYLISGLEAIARAGGKFAILTATLPPFILKYVSDSVEEIKVEKFVKGIDRHHVKVLEEEINVELISKIFRQKGGKILVICNTVKMAQKVYDSLLMEYEASELELLHAKYTREDRKIKEDAILEFGDTNYIGNKIWIATSVVEASLDIDFDYLFTELNDLNGFFQRLGRVNRKGMKADMLSEPNVYLFTEIDKNLFISNINGKRKGFIDQRMYELSKEALLGIQGILGEEKKVELINEYLTFDNIKNSYYDKRFNEVKEYISILYTGEKSLKEVKKVFRDIISYNVIPESVFQENKEVIEENREILKENFIKDSTLSDDENNKRKQDINLKKLRARDKIYNYTVPVGLYDLNVVDKLEWNNEELMIVKCNYSKERGFERIRPENQEEYFDNFF